MKPAHPRLFLLIALITLGCAQPQEGEVLEEKSAPVSRAWESARDPALAGGAKASIHFTRPGVARGEGEIFEGEAAVIEAIGAAQYTVDLCLYEFNRAPIIEALVEAITRGVEVRFVGDGDELLDEGYAQLEGSGLTLVLRRPGDRIMHNKFVILDSRSVITGSMNFSDNGVARNNNHLIHIRDTSVAELYALEFQQLYDGDFGRHKSPLVEARGVRTGEGRVEVYFAPADDPIAIVRRELSRARARVAFMVFSFSHQDLRADLIRIHNAGIDVVGIFDESQAEQGYSADDALAEAGIPVYIDGNDNRSGFAGGKLHHKVMIIDGGEAEPVVLAGSFNWSNSATRYNDENLIILRGRDYAAPFLDELCELMEDATLHPAFEGREPTPCDGWVQPVRINEVLPRAGDGYEPFVELVNAGRRAINLDGWTLSTNRGVRYTFERVSFPAGGAILLSEPEVALGFNSRSDVVTLEDPWGRVIDRVSFTLARAGVSFNRVEDGGRRGPFEAHPSLKGRHASPGYQRTGAEWLERPAVSLLINEIMPNPVGDDGGEEFVELVNVSDEPIALAGWHLGDSYSPRRHLFDEGELAPGEAVVVFDYGAHGDVPGAVNASSGRLNLDNAGDVARLFDPYGDLHDSVEYGVTRAGVSKNRTADGRAESGISDHDQVASASASPGLRADLSPWGVEAPVEPEEPEEPGEGEPRVIINELMPNPAGADLGQEYVELYNAGDAAADLEGYTLGDLADAERHIFGATILAPGEALVIFDRGAHDHIANAHISLSGRLSLNNSDDVITLLDDAGVLVDAAAYYSSQEGISLNREEDGQPGSPMVLHTTLSALRSSPGQAADGAPFGG